MIITLHTVFSFLPFIVGLAGLLAMVLRRYKSYAQQVYLLLQALLCVYLLAYGFYLMDDANYGAVAVIDVVTLFVSPAIPVLIYLYIKSLDKKFVQFENALALLIPSLLVGLGTFVIYFVIGFDDTASYLAAYDSGDVSAYNHPLYSLIKIWTSKFYTIVMGLELVLCFFAVIVFMSRKKINTFRLLGFFLGGKTYSTSSVVVSNFLLLLFMLAVRLVLGRRFFAEYEHFCWTYSVLLAFLVGVSVIFAKLPLLEDVTFRDLCRKGARLLKIDPSKLDTNNSKDSSSDKDSVSIISLENDAQLIHEMLVVDKYFLNSRASSREAASRLGISRSRLNSVVSTYCGCGFKELLKYCRENMDD